VHFEIEIEFYVLFACFFTRYFVSLDFLSCQRSTRIYISIQGLLHEEVSFYVKHRDGCNSISKFRHLTTAIHVSYCCVER